MVDYGEIALLKAAALQAQVETALDATASLGSLASVTPSGTPDGTKFLRDDNSWAVPPGGGGGVSDGDKGDIVVSGSGTVWNLDASVVASFAAASHTHGIGDLSGVAAASHTHGIGDLSGVAAASHAHGIGDLTGVAPTVHTHSFGDLSGVAAASHTHTTGDITGLGTMAFEETDAWSPDGHTHTSGEVSGLGSLATVTPSGTPDGTKFLRDDNTWATPAGGSGDGWTNVILGSDFVDSTTGNTATPLAFTPTASKTYYIEVYLLLRTAAAATGARPGFSFPTGLTDSGAWMQAPNSATASAQRWWGTTTTANAASTGLADTTNSWLAIGGALLIVGASPSGNLTVTLASETNGTNVTLKAGSFLRYREIL